MMAVLEAERAPAPVQARAGVEEAKPYTIQQFLDLVAGYPDLWMELTSEGELIIMPPTLTKSGMRNFKLTVRLGIWAEANDLGIGFESSTLLALPNGSIRAPDVAWAEKSRWEALTEQQRDGISDICPDFVAELRSQSDRLSAVQRKMREYRDNGARLGWLIDPQSNRVEIYRPGQEVEVLDAPATLSGEDVLPGFVLDLKDILD